MKLLRWKITYTRIARVDRADGMTLLIFAGSADGRNTWAASAIEVPQEALKAGPEAVFAHHAHKAICEEVRWSAAEVEVRRFVKDWLRSAPATPCGCTEIRTRPARSPTRTSRTRSATTPAASSSTRTSKRSARARSTT